MVAKAAGTSSTVTTDGGHIQVGGWSSGVDVSFTDASAEAVAADASQTRIYRLIAIDQGCYVNSFGADAAVNAGVYLPAGAVEYIRLPAATAINVIRASADGTLNVARVS